MVDSNVWCEGNRWSCRHSDGRGICSTLAPNITSQIIWRQIYKCKNMIHPHSRCWAHTDHGRVIVCVLPDVRVWCVFHALGKWKSAIALSRIFGKQWDICSEGLEDIFTRSVKHLWDCCWGEKPTMASCLTGKGQEANWERSDTFHVTEW